MICTHCGGRLLQAQGQSVERRMSVGRSRGGWPFSAGSLAGAGMVPLVSFEAFTPSAVLAVHLDINRTKSNVTRLLT